MKGRWSGKRFHSTPVRVDPVSKAAAHKHPKRQHFVPQCLLRRFAIQGAAGEPKVHFYDKLLDKEGITTIHGVASEKGFYDFVERGETFTLERGFSEIEQAADGVVESIVRARSVGHLKPTERLVLADYLIKQLLRTKQAREDAKSMLLGLETAIQRWGVSLQDAFPDYEGLTEDRLKRITMDTLRDGSISPELLLDKGWMLLETSTTAPFITSDNPVGRQNIRAQKEGWWRGSLGLRSPHVEIYFPLTPTLCLSLVSPEQWREIDLGYRRLCALEMRHPEKAFELWEPKVQCEAILKDLKTGRASSVNPEAVVNINSLQCIGCTRQVYSSTPQFDLAKQMKRDGCFEESGRGIWVSGDPWGEIRPPSQPGSIQDFLDGPGNDY